MQGNIAFIALGSNLDNPKSQLDDAIDTIRLHQQITILNISNYYITKPYGYLQQDDFVNAVIKISTSLDCFNLLMTLQSIEIKQKRNRKIKWGPRSIDLDILAYNYEEINTEILKVPHPDFQNREFVLKPWAQIDPDWLLPDGRSVSNYYQSLTECII